MLLLIHFLCERQRRGRQNGKAGSKRRTTEQSHQPQRDEVNYQVSVQHAPAKRQLPPANEITAGNHLPPGHNRFNKHLNKKMRAVPSPMCPCGDAEQDTAHV